MHEIAGQEVWQCTHLGGHRFAGTGVSIPYGAYYGRITPQDIPTLVEDYRNDRLTLKNLRGRTSFTPFEQVAEQFIRSELNIPQITALQRVASARVGDDEWIVQFRLLADNSVYRVRVHKETLPQLVYKDTDAPHPEEVYYYVATHDAT
jgi:hypothetical protein